MTLTQFYFWGYEKHRLQRLSYAMKSLLLGCFAVAAISMFAVDDVKWQWIDVVRIFHLLQNPWESRCRCQARDFCSLSDNRALYLELWYLETSSADPPMLESWRLP